MKSKIFDIFEMSIYIFGMIFLLIFYKVDFNLYKINFLELLKWYPFVLFFLWLQLLLKNYSKRRVFGFEKSTHMVMYLGNRQNTDQIGRIYHTIY
ncbi:hypothetical protein BKL49_11920 [Rodentibacter myodis]|uniref:Uncharacterized protein n=1 Tax=Rodentibacter myodis TaxID=1907939 RepID=A0A1V3JDG9_9PAST|nr:hypothetical protein BKL49_11920 [Rodentibacter myodis]